MTASPTVLASGSRAADGVSALDRRLRSALILVVCLLAFLPGIFVLPPFDRDEGRFAQASKQMLETGDLVDIRFQDEARHKKPIGIYWLQSAAVTVAGAATGIKEPGIWAYRIPSVLGATLAAVLSGWVAASLFGARAGLLAGVLMAGTLVLGVEAHLAKTDAALLAAIVLAQGVLAVAYMRRDGHLPGGGTAPIGPGLAMLFWTAVGVAILIKGPIVALVSGGTVAVLAAMDRRAGWLRQLRPQAGVPLALLIVLPWLVAITVVTKGAFFQESVGQDFAGKLFGEQAAHIFWPGYYVLTFPLSFWPSAALALFAAPWVWLHRRSPAVRFCLAWIVPTWIVFELVPVKLLHYVLPTYPAIAALVAAALLAGYDRADGRPGKWLFIAGCVLALLPAATLSLAFVAAPWWYEERIDWVAVAVVPIVLAAVAYGLRQVWFVRPMRATASLTAAALVLYATAYQRALPDFETMWPSRGIAEAFAAVNPPICPDTRLITAGYSEPSLVFLTGTDTRLVRDGALAAETLVATGPCGVAAIEERQLAAFHQRLDALGEAAFGHAIVTGINYSNGRWVFVHIFTLDAP